MFHHIIYIQTSECEGKSVFSMWTRSLYISVNISPHNSHSDIWMWREIRFSMWTCSLYMFVNVSRHNLHLDVRTHTFLSCRLVVYELLHMFHNINYIQTTGCNEKYTFVRTTISLNMFVREGIKQKYLGKCSQNGEGWSTPNL